ncbi:holo-ACP synthase [Bifidobacterium tsurumiense]|uniref:Holo-[acyl-carrier-protein] synthase n=2 Tax=Bifidobacterium tsurumiense TaxID=356829 RepID=A0A087ECJ7_9BIFI|nr:holo-ACP synthase [Bifidobacterium tsurumiense]KFJ05498.1 phosphopantetheinyl transferase [Bifidobacterium tsurumiense]MDY4677801.1 holo-ACP synthase [Bifidobacterium tsurumiense]
MHNGGMESILGLGHDVVDIAGFEKQLNEPGTRLRGLFSARELRQSTLRGESKADGEAVHLAARWAGKEAVIKAWSEALGVRDAPFTVDNMPWSQIEILDDSRGRPGVVLSEDAQKMLYESVLGTINHGSAQSVQQSRIHSREESASDTDAHLEWRISISHDGGIASAVVLLAKVE